MADNELANKLKRRQDVIDDHAVNEEDLQKPAINNNVEDEEKDAFAMADNELASKLNRRQNINEGSEDVNPTSKVANVYTEFKEFSRKQIKEYEAMFKRWA